MDQLHVTLLGKFCALHGDKPLAGCESQKVQELFCYLLLKRNRSHTREMLADLLWNNCSTAQSRAYLRRALWQLQHALSAHMQADRLLLVDADWIRLNADENLWLDVSVFEQAFSQTRDIAGRYLDCQKAQALQDATQLYTGDLLENCYLDWCTPERVRLQDMYLAMLDKLMDYYESHHKYEQGMEYGERILYIDRAREHTHCRIMRMRYLTGDRTGALRQYERCITALKEELDMKPSRSTMLLCEQIRMDQVEAPAEPERDLAWEKGQPAQEPLYLHDQLHRIKRLKRMLISVQDQIEREIEVIQLELHQEH